MDKHGFVYRGKDLVEPLLNLIEYLSALQKKFKEELLGFDTSKIPRNIMGIIDPASQQHQQIESKYKLVLMDLIKAENWLRETRRTPRTKWTLDISEVEWLHRTQRKYV